MTVVNIVTVPDPILAQVCDKIRQFDLETLQTISNLDTTLWENRNRAVGLAAPQIGEPKRIFAALRSLNKGEEPKRYVFVNPEIVKFSTAKEIGWEGCLSIPNTYCKVQRSKEITVEYQDNHANLQKLKVSGFFARVIQHEMDHLDGILITSNCIGDPVTEEELDSLLSKNSND